jgi:membrane-associated phospholipid phosphatase
MGSTAHRVTGPPPTRPRATAGGRTGSGWIEALTGGTLVALVLLAALWFRSHPGQVFFDHWGFSIVHPAPHNTTWIRLTDLRSVSILVGGSILSAVVVVGRDRWRALACLVAPTTAVVATEYLLKPVIARRYAEVLTFPSGTTTVVGSLAMAWVLAVPGRWRPPVAVVGALVVGLECIAVIALQWHYPSDALCGVMFGAGMVLLVDGVFHLVVATVRRRTGTPAPSGTVAA